MTCIEDEVETPGHFTDDGEGPFCDRCFDMVVWGGC